MRRCSCDWTNEIDARVAIERLDDGGPDMTSEEIASRFSDLGARVEGMIVFPPRSSSASRYRFARRRIWGSGPTNASVGASRRLAASSQ